MKFFLRWTTVLATLIMLSLSSQVIASAEYSAISPDMKAQNLEQAITNAADKNGDGILSEKEMKSRDRMQNRIAKAYDRLDAKNAKRIAKGKEAKEMNKITLGLILLGGGLLLWIIGAVTAVGGAFSGGFGIGVLLSLLGSLAFLAGVILLIWGLVENA